MPILAIIIFMQWWGTHCYLGTRGAFRNPGRETVKSETEGGLQIYAAVRRAAGKGSSLQCVGGVEEWRAEYPARNRQIHVVEDVADRNAEGKVIAPVRTGRHSAWTAAAAAEQRTTRASTAGDHRRLHRLVRRGLDRPLLRLPL